MSRKVLTRAYFQTDRLTNVPDSMSAPFVNDHPCSVIQIAILDYKVLGLIKMSFLIHGHRSVVYVFELLGNSNTRMGVGAS